MTKQYVWGLYIDELLEIELADSSKYYPLQDLLYRTNALTDSNGSITEKYDTDAYGKTLLFNAADETITNPTCEFIFTGRRFDPESELYFYRARYYNPELGRFLSKDPLEYEDSMGLYEYVKSRASSLLDPLGKGTIQDTLKMFAYAIQRDWDADPERATKTAKDLYNFLAFGGGLTGKKYSSEFMKRWLRKTGGVREFSNNEMKSILKNKGIKSLIAQDFNDAIRSGKISRGGWNHINSFKFYDMTFQSGEDMFTALGWFKLRFRGDYCQHGSKLQVKGHFYLTDKYDWQNPGEKNVDIAGVKIYDKWATRVEDKGLAKPFFVLGILFNHKDTYELTASGNSGGKGRR